MNYFPQPPMNRPIERRGSGWPRRARFPVSVAASAVFVAACGSSQSAPTTTPAPAARSGPSNSALKLGSATLPKVGSVFTGPNGMTLYYFTSDTPTATSCTGQCAVVWPPLVVPAGSTPVLSSGLSGPVTIIKRPDGSNQVSYEGHLLYYYQGDTTPGQDRGQGVEGTWFVLSTSPAHSAGSPTATTSPGGGGGGVGF